jgi:lipoprotein-anchoring transpeptidase ErfK/SrfK
MKTALNIQISLLLTAASVSLLTSCGSVRNNQGQTAYLDAFDPATVPQTATYNADTVSYWDGAGLSGPASILIDLSDQKAYFYKGGSLAGISALSTGDEGHPTTPGNFKITEKDIDHRSNLYGDFVDGAGNVVVRDVTAGKDIPPPGTHFLGSDMAHFMRFNGGTGMHKGYLPGYAASHGCVRMPAHMAEIFYHNVTVGVPVTVQR